MFDDLRKTPVSIRESTDIVVAQIIEIEWGLFDKVTNIGGRASCQDDFPTFYAMRKSQFEAWDEATRESYLADLREAMAADRNPVLEKYAYMTGYPYFGSDDELREKQADVSAIHDSMMEDTLRIKQEAPLFMRYARPVERSAHGAVALGDYLYCELLTYSARTLRLLRRHVDELACTPTPLPRVILENTARLYGYASIAAAEERLVCMGAKSGGCCNAK